MNEQQFVQEFKDMVAHHENEIAIADKAYRKSAQINGENHALTRRHKNLKARCVFDFTQEALKWIQISKELYGYGSKEFEIVTQTCWSCCQK